MYNSTGTLFAKYNYDAWGNIISVTNASGVEVSDNHIAKLQPFRYRSYYYDTDSGFYYLQSRYYDPVTHRFINADGLVSTGTGILGHNMFAYCNNNPVNYSDPTGEHPTGQSCGDPTCVVCRPERRDFINKKVEWYNKVTGDNIIGVTDNGYFVYEKSNPMMTPRENFIIFSDNRHHSKPDIQIINSYLIADKTEMKPILEFMKTYNEDNPIPSITWDIDMDKMLAEWAAHNFAHNCGVLKNRTKSVNLNMNDPLSFIYGVFR